MEYLLIHVYGLWNIYGFKCMVYGILVDSGVWSMEYLWIQVCVVYAIFMGTVYDL